jgi:hypothetical protein
MKLTGWMNNGMGEPPTTKKSITGEPKTIEFSF